MLTLTSKIINDQYTEYIYNTFDIQNQEETTVEIPVNLQQTVEFDWNIGVILGNSGSGKTSILKELGDIKEAHFDFNKPLISNFDWMTPQEATSLLSSMGLSSVPTWLRPYRLLSNGEQYRARLAYIVASHNDEGNVILMDEYTSVVDRDVAKAMSFALQKYIRKHNKQIILASCHYDILEWLMPDWIYSTQKGGVLERCDYLRQGRPKIELQISRVEADTWNIFKKHHYLSEFNNKAYAHYLFTWNNIPVAINVVSPLPSAYIKEAFRGSRTVVLPDYQGLGFGAIITDFIASIYKHSGKRFYTKTVHPALGEYRNKSSKWRGTPDNGKIRKPRKVNYTFEDHWKHNSRASYCHEYIGEGIEGFEELILPIKELRNKCMINSSLSIKN